MPLTAASAKYELVRQLATGGMGEIFLARQRGPAGFDRPVVLKKILKHLAADPSFVEQFLNEGRLVARVSHPNVVQILELGESEGGGWFLALEYIHGVTLREVRQKLRAMGEPFPLRLAAWIAAQALHGLHAAHEQRDENGKPLGLVHRDVSPDNIMLGYSGAVKLLDFGVAKATAAVSTTRPGTLKGKIPYLAPEVISGDLTTPSADLYAMGVVLYEVAAGKRPFAAENEAALLKKVMNDEPVPLKVAAPSVDDELADIIGRALMKDRLARFPTARAMAEALERYAASGGEPQSATALSGFMAKLFGDVAPPTLDGEAPARGTVTFERPDSLPTQMDAEKQPATVSSAPVAAPGSRRGVVLAAAIAVAVVAVGGFAAVVLRPVAKGPEPVPVVVVEKVPVAVAEPVVDAGAEEPVDEAPEPEVPVKGAAKKKTGRVLVQVQPWAEVYEGARRLGVTPMPALALPVGTHVLLLKNPQLGVEKRVTVKVSPGATATVRVTLEK